MSPRQEQQLTCWGGNVTALRVDGTFDDCQRMVKEAFVDQGLQRRHRFSSANSINIGRLLPQMVYYAASSLEIRRRTGSRGSYIIPAGNLGNAFAAIWARALGFPVERIVLAQNRNRTVLDFLQSGEWQPRPSIATLASAMDVGNPSNMERLRSLYGPWMRCARSCRRTASTTPRSAPASAPITPSSDAHLVPAHGDRGRGLPPPAGRRTARQALGAGGDRAPGQVQRDRRAADRHDARGSRAAGPPARPAERLPRFAPTLRPLAAALE